MTRSGEQEQWCRKCGAEWELKRRGRGDNRRQPFPVPKPQERRPKILRTLRDTWNQLSQQTRADLQQAGFKPPEKEEVKISLLSSHTRSRPCLLPKQQRVQCQRSGSLCHIADLGADQCVTVHRSGGGKHAFSRLRLRVQLQKSLPKECSVSDQRPD